MTDSRSVSTRKKQQTKNTIMMLKSPKHFVTKIKANETYNIKSKFTTRKENTHHVSSF